MSNRSIGSPERCLKDIRGTASITNFEDGDVVITPVRGKQNFSITNTSVDVSSIGQTLSSIFNTTVNAALEVSVTFDVVFSCPFRSTPTVVLSLENTNTSTSNAILNSFGVFASNVSEKGFTVNVALNIYGENLAEALQLVVELFLPESGSSVDFIAQGH